MTPVRGNHLRNGGDRWSETRKICLPKVALFENSYGQCAVQHRALWNAGWHGWWALWLGVAETACRSRSPLYWFKDVFELNEYLHINFCSRDSVTAQCHTVHRSFQKVQLCVSGYLRLPFLTRFSRTRCHIKWQGFGNKMFISESFTVIR